jgi:hypothetical protein
LTELRKQMREYLRNSVHPGWFQDWARKEAQAAALRTWQPLVVPGLLQTEEYARAVFRTRLMAADDEISEMVAARLERQAILVGGDPPMLWVILDEAVLRRPVGGPDVMREQLGRLARTRQDPRVVVQVVPLSVGANEGLAGSFILAEFRDGPTAVYQETPVGGQVISGADDLAVIEMIWDTLRSVALPRSASLDLIEEAAKSWT